MPTGPDSAALKLDAAVPKGVIMFWNIENYFHPSDDPEKDDDEFTPRGEKRWSYRRYRRKGVAVAKTMAAVAAKYGSFPVVAAFAEIENRRVLYHIAADTPLEKFEYGVIHRESPDARGIDVGLIYRKGAFRPVAVDSLEVAADKPTRSILYVKGILEGVPHDTLHIFVNHWPSKIGTQEAAARRRAAAAETVRRMTDSLRREGRAVVAMGDFNDTPPEVDLGLENLALPLHEAGVGSLKYAGEWELIDQFHIGGGLRGRMEVFSPPFLLEPDKGYLGVKPRRTYIGPRYNGGVSDHLPIVLLLM